MRKLLAIAATCLAMSGCVNVYTRWPTTDIKIESTYQCTCNAFDISLIVAFPQTMGYGNEKGFIWENIFTIPLGLLGLVDVACEGVLDTVCLPYDWPISNHRKKQKQGE